jgi:hypothetical protein
MRRAWPLAVAVVAAAGALAGGCMLFQGGTDGYSPASAEGGVGGSCKTVDDCSGMLCCYELDGASAAASCQASCAPYQQACKIASDCGDGGACITNDCTIEASVSASATVTTCGPIPICSQ